jgi:hypothetical protein
MVWNVLSLALDAEGIHVATCLHAKIRTLLVTGLWFSPVSSINKTDSDYITEILLKVGLNTINIHT